MAIRRDSLDLCEKKSNRNITTRILVIYGFSRKPRTLPTLVDGLIVAAATTTTATLNVADQPRRMTSTTDGTDIGVTRNVRDTTMKVRVIHTI